MNRTSKVAVSLVSGALLVSQAMAADTVKIGVAGPLTGGLAQQGKDVENGARLAVDQLNASGFKIKGAPVHFEIDSEDDRADPKTAVTVAQKLVDGGAVGVVGHLTSGTSLPASKVYSNAGIPEISPSATNPMLTRQGFATSFRVIGDDSDVGRVIAQYMAKTKGYKRVAVIDDRTAYGQGIADIVVENLKKNGVDVVDREYVTPNTLDFRSVLTAVKGATPQAVFYGGTDAQAAPLRKQMTGLSMSIPLVGSSIETENFIKLAGPGAEGTVSAESGQPLDTMAGGKKFIEEFKKYGPVVLYAPYGYDAVMALAHAMQLANSTNPKDFLPAMKKISFDGVTGPIAFDQKGDLRSTGVTLYQAKGGRFVPLQTVR
ncbi:branched-chain amino acid ABC transporter substrate-binding protein [Burkholderia cenocepacia]|uniref:branched-chain amino acid ABC transporter substrate-binding protein n=1 Tax=Burkholderia cenocepacia TaxID=95486 RepID=UPI001BA19EA7|nr:branched-chain amino acid ABC transporter substrate-binding protein [Burkholderia cenocepacia]MBR8168038.1 branched-chain amino acid ABC transporter substrate-binding protein [Burkholderia cenocepacia]